LLFQSQFLNLCAKITNNIVILVFLSQIGVVNSCYVVPHEGGKERLQSARASAEYHGGVIMSDLQVQNGDHPEDPHASWYGKAHMFFKATESKRVWNWDKGRQDTEKVVHDLVFIRWYKELGYTDATKCPQLEWESRPGRTSGTTYCTL
jgi:hypothetical protein